MTGVVLIVAKAPRAGRVKTRLTPDVDAGQAAAIATASLLDTLDAAVGTGCPVAVAWAGEPVESFPDGELASAMLGNVVVPQRGTDLGERLAAAHLDVGRLFPGEPILQIGMDTPQVTAELLTDCLRPLRQEDGPEAVLGPACDGGWWALGAGDPRRARVLRQVTMSTADTGTRTLAALRADGLRVDELPALSDVDTMSDAETVAARAPESRFARAVADVAAAGGRS